MQAESIIGVEADWRKSYWNTIA